MDHVKKRRALLLACLLVLTGAVFAVRGRTRPELAAVYGGVEIRRADLEKLRATAEAGEAELSDRELAERAVRALIITEEAERLGVAASEEEAERLAALTLQSFAWGYGREEMEAVYADKGLTEEEYYAVLKQRAYHSLSELGLRSCLGREYCREQGVEYRPGDTDGPMQAAVEEYMDALVQEKISGAEFYG